MRDLSLLDSGIYSVADARRLIRLPEMRVRRWIDGDRRTSAEAILKNEIGWAGGKLAFSFVNLMEIRFLAFFASHGVRIQSIRIMADEAKRILGHPHPFATSTVFKTDGKAIYSETQRQTGDDQLYNLLNRNFEFKPIIAQSLKDGVVYDPSGLIRAWYPREDIAPNVLVHPKHAFGKPILKDSGIPTKTLADATELDSVATVAKWFEVSRERVNEAIRFEKELKRAA
jgi:uncharacterized protein (DUF433 family)